MKKITKIEYQKKNKDRVSIYLDDNYAFGIDLNIMIKYSLAKNMELEDDFINEILKSDEEMNAYNYAISVLSRNSKSEKQLMQKIKDKGYEEQFIENVIVKLKQQKYIDDEAYSEAFINNKINISKDGKRKIKEALYNKGIDKQIIDEKLQEITDDDEIERACLLGAKKLRTIKEEDIRKRRMKLANYLISKGFEYSTVKKVISKLFDKNDFDEFGDFEY
ncbi:MAG: RecX family transcriptional regulator [Sedimentibacter sp.]|uniref:RecX family transcriptional regulator n=1 Tax=Sedimentibacter sp. TaxID=1960295 RepID=UPI00298290AB|nr:RecX family transcriptional regulator [Sedimentibacter sp.]MDW5300051.1 RecX family transcriptional regulator [Sedimentibacter sp.]